MSMITKAEPRNRLLAGLPADEMKRLRPHLEFFPTPLRAVLYEAEQDAVYAYFPEDAVISLLAVLESGKSVEVTLIGHEGVLGVPSALGAKTTLHTAITQVPGSCLRIQSDILRAEFRRCGLLHDRLLGFTLSLLIQVSQTAVCNRVHFLEQRMARWLLMACDRSERQEFPMTHEFLSHVLGSPRSEISLAAGSLRKAGLIHYSRGTIKILDPLGLRSRACECSRADLTSSRS
jgi:CRP-like cAMP-binding protein